ncbi:MAG TPA: hypothetical protein DCL44_07430 [Elusimicrobia bacterium]|nr:hypothetical protein [Elusimicrobiota bacterium]
MASYHNKLKKDLDLCAAEGLISPEQAEGVYQRSIAATGQSGWKAAHLIALFSGVLIAAGVILVIAHNWDKLGAIAKIAGFLLAFAAAAEISLCIKGQVLILDRHYNKKSRIKT